MIGAKDSACAFVQQPLRVHPTCSPYILGVNVQHIDVETCGNLGRQIAATVAYQHHGDGFTVE